MTEEEQVIEAVASLLRDHHPEDANLEVVSEAVHRNGEYWYVPVRPDVQPRRTFEYYDALADVESVLSEQRNLKVLLVPTVPIGK